MRTLPYPHGAAGSSVRAWDGDTVPRFPPPRPASVALYPSPELGAGSWAAQEWPLVVPPPGSVRTCWMMTFP